MDKNVKVVGIGFFLIAVVAMVIFVRQYPLKNAEKEGLSSSGSTVPEIAGKSITGAELARRRISEPDLAIMDLRSKAEFDKEHIADSKNAVMESLEFLDKGETYVFVYDDSSPEKLAALDRALKETGIRDYYYLAGGFSAWKAEYNPTVSEGDPQSFTDQAKVTYISSDELNKMIGSEGNLYIVDLRSSRQYAEGHLKDAVNIPLEDLERRKDSIPPGRRIILYDTDGLGAFKGAVRLYDLGTFGARALQDGFAAWKEKGFEVVK